MALTFRPADPDDVPALHALIEGAYRGDSARAGWTHEADLVQTPRTTAQTLSELIADPDELLLLALHHGTLIGCVQITRLTQARAYLGLLTVDPRRQAGGLGRSIMQAAESEAIRRFGAREMELTVISRRPELIAYYQRRGYALTGEEREFPIPLDPPLNLLVMRKPMGK